MTSAKEKAYKLRHIILVVGIVFTLAGIIWMILPFLSDLDDFAGLFGTADFQRIAVPVKNLTEIRELSLLSSSSYFNNFKLG